MPDLARSATFATNLLIAASRLQVRLGATGHTSEVLGIALSPCGATLASAGKVRSSEYGG